MPPYCTFAHTTPSITSKGTVAPIGPLSDETFDRYLRRWQNRQNPVRLAGESGQTGPGSRAPPQPNVSTFLLPNSSSYFDQVLSQYNNDLSSLLKENLGVDIRGKTRTHQKPYPSYFDSISYSAGFRLPDFVKFDGESNKSTFEHISQYVAQLGEAGAINELKVRLFSLSLTGTTFSWFSSLAPNSITMWDHLEQKFHDHFFCGNNDLKLSDLTLVKQMHDESVNDYIRRFHDTKNHCFGVNIPEKDLADLSLYGLRSHVKEKLEDFESFNVSRVHQRA